MNETVVSSQTNPLAYLKAIATLVGTIVTGLLGIYASDTPVGTVLLVLSVIATAVATWAVPNAIVVPGEVVDSRDGWEDDYEDDDVDDEDWDEDDEDLSYEESGGMDFPVDADEGVLYHDDMRNPDEERVASGADVIGEENMPADEPGQPSTDPHRT